MRVFCGCFWFKVFDSWWPGQDGIRYDGVDDLAALVERTETVYTRYFTMGDHSRAMSELRVPERVHEPFDWNIIATGMFVGVTLFSIISISASRRGAFARICMQVTFLLNNENM